MVYRADGTVDRLFEHDTLSGEDVLPGFTAKLAELLPPTSTADRPSATRVIA